MVRSIGEIDDTARVALHVTVPRYGREMLTFVASVP
jgi:hypothetical protein